MLLGKLVGVAERISTSEGRAREGWHGSLRHRGGGGRAAVEGRHGERREKMMKRLNKIRVKVREIIGDNYIRD